MVSIARGRRQVHGLNRTKPPKAAITLIRAFSSEDGYNRFEIPKEMRSMAEASFDQACKAFEKFVASAQATAGSVEERGATVRAGARDISAKAMSYAEKNVQASLDYAQALLHAKDLTEVMRLHSDYVRTQMRSLAEQASEMGQAVGRAAMDATSPKARVLEARVHLAPLAVRGERPSRRLNSNASRLRLAEKASKPGPKSPASRLPARF
jgi:phasin